MISIRIEIKPHILTFEQKELHSGYLTTVYISNGWSDFPLFYGYLGNVHVSKTAKESPLIF